MDSLKSRITKQTKKTDKRTTCKFNMSCTMLFDADDFI